MTMLARLATSTALVLAVVISANCGGSGDLHTLVGPDTTAKKPPAAASVTLSQDTATLVPSGQVVLHATVRDASGQTITRDVTWTSSDTGRAKVVGGTVTGIAPGAAIIQAAADGQVSAAHVTVSDGGVVGTAGGTVTALGGQVTLTIPANALAQSTSITVAPAVAPTADPRLVGHSAIALGPLGTSIAQPVTVSVRYDPASVPAQTDESHLAIYLDSAGSWHLVAGSTVDAGAKSVSAGIAHFGSYAILATPDPIAGIEIRPGAASVQVGSTVQLIAQATDAAGQIITGRPVTWSSDKPAVATVSIAGVVTAISAGTAVITATSEGKSATATITVPSSPSTAPATITISSNRNTTWVVNPGGLSGSGTSGSYSVSANGSGTTYTIVPSVLDGYTVAVTNSDGGGTSLTLGPGQTKGFTLTYTPIPATQPTATLTATPTEVTAGQTATLSWNSTNATSCAGSWTNGVLAPSGSQTVAPATTTNYSITCSGSGGTAVASKTVTVAAAATGALAVSITGLPNGALGNVSVTGPGYANTVTATGTLTGLVPGQYTLVANSVSAGNATYVPTPAQQTRAVSANATATATVTYAVVSPPTVAINASPTSIPSGQGTTVSWSSTGAATCSSSWSSSIATGGSQLFQLTATTTFTITCTGAGGSATGSATVTVTPAGAIVTAINPGTPTAAPSDQVVHVIGSGFQQNLTVAVAYPGGSSSLSGSGQIQNVTSNAFDMVIRMSVPGSWSIRVVNPGQAPSDPFSFTVVQGTSSGADHFVWPVDPSNSAAGYFGSCADWPGDSQGCYWLAPSSWRDVQPFQKHLYSGHGYHLGADWNLGSGSQDANLPVYAVADGVVTSVQTNVAGWGNLVFVQHATSFGTYTSMYAHVNWMPGGPPAVGSQVSKGQQIALIGNGSNCCNYPYHLHLEIRSGTSTAAGLGYTQSQVTQGPQGQIDPDAFIATHH